MKRPDWTFEEWLAWGRTERDTRKDELAKMNSAESLENIKTAVKRRRNLVGLNAGQAACAARAADFADGDMIWKAKGMITWPILPSK